MGSAWNCGDVSGYWPRFGALMELFYSTLWYMGVVVLSYTGTSFEDCRDYNMRLMNGVWENTEEYIEYYTLPPGTEEDFGASCETVRLEEGAFLGYLPVDSKGIE